MTTSRFPFDLKMTLFDLWTFLHCIYLFLPVEIEIFCVPELKIAILNIVKSFRFSSTNPIVGNFRPIRKVIWETCLSKTVNPIFSLPLVQYSLGTCIFNAKPKRYCLRPCRFRQESGDLKLCWTFLARQIVMTVYYISTAFVMWAAFAAITPVWANYMK